MSYDADIYEIARTNDRLANLADFAATAHFPFPEISILQKEHPIRLRFSFIRLASETKRLLQRELVTVRG